MTCRSIVILTQIHKQSQLKVVFLSFYFAWITFLVKSFLIKDVEIPGFCSSPANIADERREILLLIIIYITRTSLLSVCGFQGSDTLLLISHTYYKIFHG